MNCGGAMAIRQIDWLTRLHLRIVCACAPLDPLPLIRLFGRASRPLGSSGALLISSSSSH